MFWLARARVCLAQHVSPFLLPWGVGLSSFLTVAETRARARASVSKPTLPLLDLFALPQSLGPVGGLLSCSRSGFF